MIAGRAKCVLIYTASLLLGPVPVMPFEKGTRAFGLGVMACGVILSLASFYVVRGELGLRARSLLGNKLLAASLITLLFGLSMLLGSLVYLSLA